MKTVTLEKFLTFEPCWLEEEGGEERLLKIGSRRKEWTAMDVLALEEVSAEDRLWAVLREDFISKNVLNEFACLCIEHALTIAGVTDERCWNVINVKRAWLRGEASDDEFVIARDSAFDAARDMEGNDARAAVRAAAKDVASDAAFDESWNAAWYAAADAERAVARYANDAERVKACNSERAWQIETLKRLIVENEKEEQK